MTTFTGPQLRQLALDAGFPAAVAGIAAAIALAESGGRSDAIGDTALQDKKWGPSVGLWQVRSLKNPSAYSGVDAMRVADKLLDPKYNAQVAYAISKSKGSFSDWSTFNDNKYRSYTDAVGGASVTEKLTDAVTSPVDTAQSTAAALGSIGSLASKVQDGSLWKRAGLYVGGYFLVVGGLLVILLSNKEVRGAISGVAETGVGLVPGGGVVTKVAKTAGKVTK